MAPSPSFTHHPLRQQLLMLVVGVVALTLAISLLSALLIQWDLHKGQVSRSLETTAQSAAIAVSAAVAFDDGQAAADALRILAARKDIQAAGVYRLDDRRIATFGDGALLPDEVGWIEEHGADFYPLSASSSLMLPIVLDNARLGWIYLHVDLREYRAAFLKQAMLAILAGLFGLGLAIWLGLRFIERILQPVQALAELAHQVRENEDFSLRATGLDNSGADNEIGELVISFNAMLAEIEKRERELREYQRDLEFRVEERTCQLADTNAALQSEIRSRAHSEAVIRASEDKLRGLFELAPLGIALTDMQGRYIDFNESFRAICGYPAEELKQLDYWTLTPEKYRAEENVQLEALLRTGRYGPYEKEYLRKDGSLIPINLNGRLVTGADDRTYIWSIVEDISTRRQNEAQLRAQKQ